MHGISTRADHGPHSGAWDPSATDGTSIVLFHVRQALVAVDSIRARMRADNHTTDFVSAPAEQGQASSPTTVRAAPLLGDQSTNTTMCVEWCGA